MTAATETQREAYHSLTTPHLQNMERRVLYAFQGRADTTFTRQQLAVAVGMPLNAICGRANSLLTKKVLCVRGFHLDPATRKRQELLGYPVVQQGVLF